MGQTAVQTPKRCGGLPRSKRLNFEVLLDYAHIILHHFTYIFKSLMLLIPVGGIILLSGCDDLHVILTYPKSTIQEKAEKGQLAEGDILFNASDYDKFCIVSPLSDLRDYSNGDQNVFFSEEFYFVVLQSKNGKEVIERIHSTWLQTPHSNSLCVESPGTIQVKDVDNDQRLYLEISKGLRDG